MFVLLSVCLSICLLCLYVCLYVCLSVCLTACLYVCTFVCLLIGLFVCFTICTNLPSFLRAKFDEGRLAHKESKHVGHHVVDNHHQYRRYEPDQTLK